MQRQIERDNLQELIDDHISRHGDFTPEELAAAEAELFGTASREGLSLLVRDDRTMAARLAAAAKLHGHKYAIDAIVCATALAQPGLVSILTSDVEDIQTLATGHTRIAAIKV
ncbi:hypothetical protein [Streptomyces coryli]|uniref:hypothetical protein n=1 Tax=Streptomyces coryli TaxID=1128680 RepID=UPI0030B8F263